MAKLDYKKNGRKIGILVGSVLALIPGIWWLMVSGWSTLNICLTLFLMNGIVACFSYLGRHIDSYYKTKTLDAGNAETDADDAPSGLIARLKAWWNNLPNSERITKRRFAGVLVFTAIGLAVGIYAIAHKVTVASQFSRLPIGLLYGFYLLNAVALLTSLGSRFLDRERAPTINYWISRGTIAGIGIGAAVCVSSAIIWGSNPFDLLFQVKAYAHGTAGLTFGPFGSAHGLILAMLSFVIVGASIGEYLGKISLWFSTTLDTTKAERKQFLSANNAGKEAYLNIHKFIHLNAQEKKDLRTSIENYSDFTGASVGTVLGAVVGGLIAAYGCSVPINTPGGIALRFAEVVLASFTMASICSRVASIAGDPWAHHEETMGTLRITPTTGDNTGKNFDTALESSPLITSSSFKFSSESSERSNSQLHHTSARDKDPLCCFL